MKSIYDTPHYLSKELEIHEQEIVAFKKMGDLDLRQKMAFENVKNAIPILKSRIEALESRSA